jgi:hypothetical protein
VACLFDIIVRLSNLKRKGAEFHAGAHYNTARFISAANLFAQLECLDIENGRVLHGKKVA